MEYLLRGYEYGHGFHSISLISLSRDSVQHVAKHTKHRSNCPSDPFASAPENNGVQVQFNYCAVPGTGKFERFTMSMPEPIHIAKRGNAGTD